MLGIAWVNLDRSSGVIHMFTTTDTSVLIFVLLSQTLSDHPPASECDVTYGRPLNYEVCQEYRLNLGKSIKLSILGRFWSEQHFWSGFVISKISISLNPKPHAKLSLSKSVLHSMAKLSLLNQEWFIDWNIAVVWRLIKVLERKIANESRYLYQFSENNLLPEIFEAEKLLFVFLRF